MKRIAFLTVVCACLLGAQGNDLNFKMEKDGSGYAITWNEETIIEKIPTQIAMNGLLGNVYVTGKMGKTIRYTEKMTLNVRTAKEAKALWEEYHFTLKASDFGYELSPGKRTMGGSRKVKVEYLIDLPANTSLATRTLGGKLNIKNLMGEMDLATAGGDLILSRLNGKITAKTAGGNLKISDLEGSISLYTAGGDITGSNLLGDLHIETAGGDISLMTSIGNLDLRTLGGDLKIHNHKGDRAIMVTFGGDISAENISGDINMRTNGGDIGIQNAIGNLEAKTFGGDIFCSEMNGNVILESMGGDIRGKKITGSVQVENRSGDVHIQKIFGKGDDHSIRISADNGKITLVLPTLENTIVNALSRGYKAGIKSDFEMNIMQKDPRRIYVNERFGKGDYLIDLKADNGDIQIIRTNP
ncbi:MAG TPA: hypothetical protein ENN84_03790 [Candidatus Marinimicrobia bacterium]|nr:hypothetical protein [Candidatus Neomarinimicrobiota bacterium]